MDETTHRNLTRRRLLGATSAIGTTALLGGPSMAAHAEETTAPPPNHKLGALGANFNGLLPNLDFRELKMGRTQWVRGFLPVIAADQGDPSKNSTIRAALSAVEHGYRTLLSLKFPYRESTMPAPDSPAMTTALAQVDKLLPLVLNQVDILEIGNEPFIESRPDDRDDALNTFYETVAAHIIAYRRSRFGADCKTRLYMGALNRLDLPDRQTTATERWMTFVRETPEIDGVDIHPHVPSPEAVEPFLDYILPRMRPEQTFLVTEFSLVWLWKAHLSDAVSATFADKYGFSRDSQVWQVIRAATHTPFPQEQWDAFMASNSWFESRKSFLRDQMTRFRATDRLAVATYTYRQAMPMSQDYNPDKPPWALNCVFAPYTVRHRQDGTIGRGYPWFDEFRALQRR